MLLSLLREAISNLLFFVLHVTGNRSLPRPLSAQEEHEYLKRWKNGDTKACSKLVEHNLHLVTRIIRRYYSSLNDRENLISIGTTELVKVIDSFNGDKEIQLPSYAARCIESEVLMFFRSGKKNIQDTSLNGPINTGKDGNTLTPTNITSTEDNIVDNLDCKIESEQLKKCICQSLSPRGRTIIELCYNLSGQAPLAQREVASALDISRSYISRVEKKALGALLKQFGKQKIRLEDHKFFHIIS